MEKILIKYLYISILPPSQNPYFETPNPKIIYSIPLNFEFKAQLQINFFPGLFIILFLIFFLMIYLLYSLFYAYLLATQSFISYHFILLNFMNCTHMKSWKTSKVLVPGEKVL